MPNPNVSFNGAQIINPGAYSKIDASELVPSSKGLATVVAILGDATGGQPGVPLFFRSGASAKAVLRSGNLLDAIRFAYDPANDGSTGGADLVIAIRTDPATQSTLSLAGATGTPVVLTSRDWGLWTTNIQVKVETGSTSGKKVTIQYVDATLGTITEVYDNQANSAAVIAAINNGISGGQAPSQFVTAASGTGTDPLTNVVFTNLAGGVDGTTTSTNYTNALNALLLEAVDIVCVVTNDPTITALVQAHVATASTTKGRAERMAVVGGAPAAGFATTDLYVADLVSKAQALANERVMLVGPGIKRPNSSGVVTTYGPEFLAAIIAGLAAALEVGQSPTGKYVKLVGLDAQFSESQIETLLLGGVCPVRFRKDRGFQIVQAVTTWQTDNNPIHREWSVRRVGDVLMKDIRTTLENQFIGARGDATTVNSMLTATVARLQRFLSDRAITAFRNVSITVANTVATVSFEFSPAEPIDYILITGTAKPGSLAATYSGQDTFTGTVGA